MYHVAYCLENMRLISAHHDSIMTVVNVEHVAVPSHEPLVDFPFLMELVQPLCLYNVSFFKVFLARSILTREDFVTFVVSS